MNANQARHKLQVARTLLDTGMFAADAPGQGAALAGGAAPLGADAGGRLRGRGVRYPERAGDRRRARHADLRGGAPAHERAGARAAAGGHLRTATGVAIMCRNHRGFIEATVACSKLGRQRAVSEHRVRRPADHRRARARGPGGGDLRRGVRRAGARRARRRACASSPGATPGARARPTRCSSS